jgi:chemotaxis protein methyltransferase CheR
MIAQAAEQFCPFPGVSEHIYSRADFEAVRELVYRESGNVLPLGKATLVYSRLAPLVRATNTGTFAAYIERVRTDDEERRRAVSALTTNHTFFFREDHHFDHFRTDVRPDLVARLQRRDAVRMWSAGCSSGEEVFSLVMTLLGEDKVEGRRIAGGDLAILATDLSDPILAKARETRYAPEALEPVPARLRDNWVQPDGRMGETARNLVRFRRLNLLGPWPIHRPFDVIFCRNVMIYFDQPTKETLVARFAEQLMPGGYLYIGHSERVTGRAASVLQPVGNTIYRKVA